MYLRKCFPMKIMKQNFSVFHNYPLHLSSRTIESKLLVSESKEWELIKKSSVVPSYKAAIELWAEINRVTPSHLESYKYLHNAT